MGRDTTRAWRVVVFGLGVMATTVALGGGALAQSPAPSVEPGRSAAAADAGLFPSAPEVSRILGVDVESRGVQGGLSQAWEGADFYSESLPSAQMATYTSSPEEGEESLTGVVIDIVRFESGDDALKHTTDVMFGDELIPSGFETELAGELIATISFPADEGFGGSLIALVTGPVAIVVAAFATDVLELEDESEAIVRTIQDRLIE